MGESRARTREARQPVGPSLVCGHRQGEKERAAVGKIEKRKAMELRRATPPVGLEPTIFGLEEQKTGQVDR